MKLLKNTLLFFMLLLSLYSFAGSKNNWFRYELVKKNEGISNCIHVYFDRKGDLYPNSNVPVESGFYLDCYSKAEDGVARLEKYFLRHKDKLDALAKEYQVIAGSSVNETYSNCQTAIRSSIVKNLNNQLTNEKKQLIVLIHGFNTHANAGTLDSMKSKIEQNEFGKENTVYLMVHWDGLEGTGLSNVSYLWKSAQPNSSNVAIGLRKLLNGVKEAPIRILTHSLGASVATGALFNTTAKWNNNPEWEELFRSTNSPTQKDIRLAMLAPAIPGANTFCDFNKRGTREILPNENNVSKVIVGHKGNDIVLNKVVMASPIFGATTLGCNYTDKNGVTEIQRVKEKLDSVGYNEQMQVKLLFPIDFRKEINGHTKKHGVESYMANNEKFKEVLNLLLQ